MTPREAKNFFAHMKISHPEMTLTLRSHLNSMGDWTKVKKVFFPRSWYVFITNCAKKTLKFKEAKIKLRF